MSEKTFKTYMAAAQSVQSVNPEFWHAYMRGLRRLYHGENFGTDSEHKQWMNCGDGGSTIAPYPDRQAGYRAGYAGKHPSEFFAVA